jgi:hypothetical protein
MEGDPKGTTAGLAPPCLPEQRYEALCLVSQSPLAGARSPLGEFIARIAASHAPAAAPGSPLRSGLGRCRPAVLGPTKHIRDRRHQS